MLSYLQTPSKTPFTTQGLGVTGSLRSPQRRIKAASEDVTPSPPRRERMDGEGTAHWQKRASAADTLSRGSAALSGLRTSSRGPVIKGIAEGHPRGLTINKCVVQWWFLASGFPDIDKLQNPHWPSILILARALSFKKANGHHHFISKVNYQLNTQIQIIFTEILREKNITCLWDSIRNPR